MALNTICVFEVLASHFEYSFFMILGSIPVILIQTPGLIRANPLISDLSGVRDIKLSVLPATMVQTPQDIHKMKINIRLDLFEVLENRKMSPPEIGCAYSHNIAREYISKSLIGGVILEDDARIANLQSFKDLIDRFLITQRGKPSVLNLTGLNFRNQDSAKFAENVPLSYFRILGQPSLAVGYALTAEAAWVLKEANTPIASVSDWPTSICKFYVPLTPLVLHGDVDTVSTIEAPTNSFRSGISRRHKLDLMSPKMLLIFINRGYGVKRYFKEVLYKRITWRMDNISLKLRLQTIKWFQK